MYLCGNLIARLDGCGGVEGVGQHLRVGSVNGLIHLREQGGGAPSDALETLFANLQQTRVVGVEFFGRGVENAVQFQHFITPGGDLSNEWLEPVTDEVYGQLKNGEIA